MIKIKEYKIVLTKYIEVDSKGNSEEDIANAETTFINWIQRCHADDLIPLMDTTLEQEN